MNLYYTKRSEDTEQAMVIKWAKRQENYYQELKWLYHCPNGGSRNKMEAVKLKQMGVRAGVSDLILPYPKGDYIGLCIEMKHGNNTSTPDQLQFLADMAATHHFVATCYSADEAIAIIKEYLKLNQSIMTLFWDKFLVPLENYRMGIPNNAIHKNGKVKEKEKT